MPVDVRVPQLGESVVEATVGSWLKKEGDAVAAGEALVQLETEKVNVEVAAERAGVLERISRKEGETVAPGDVLAVLGDKAQESGAGAAAPSGAAQPPPAPSAPTTAAASAPSAASTDGAQRAEAQQPRVSPEARRVAEEHGVDLAKVTGSGPAGRVMAADVEQFMRQAAPTPTPSAPPAAAARPAIPTPSTQHPTPAREERARMSRRRQVIAQRLVEAQHTAAMLTTFNEVDMTAVMELRTRRRDAFKERHGVSLGFMSFFTKAVVGALKAFPRLNAEIQGDEIVLKRYYDIGIAVGAEEGLVVPVVRDADRLTFADVERKIVELAERARKNALTLEDLRGGTFTITNGGVFGSLMSTPILNPPQVGILGMHKIEQRAVVKDGQIVARPMMYLALSYDHRIVDGREAVQFLVRVKELVEEPESLLLEG
jgi:2-oxoglutarate dehydrogenase E2 component (dihydrolipoamide succinyltransferase)